MKKYPPSFIKEILYIKSASCLSPYPKVCKVNGILFLPFLEINCLNLVSAFLP